MLMRWDRTSEIETGEERSCGNSRRTFCSIVPCMHLDVQHELILIFTLRKTTIRSLLQQLVMAINSGTF